MRGGLLLAAFASVGLIAAAPAPQVGTVEVVTGELAIVDALLDGDAHAAVVASLTALGGDETAVRTLLDGGVGEQLLTIGDLDGDELPDVVGLARAPRPYQETLGGVEQLTVTARSGATGVALWSEQVLGMTGTIVDTANGFVLVSVSGVGQAVVQHLNVFGDDGALRWSRSDAGVVGTTAVQWPTYVGQLTTAAGAVQHVVQHIDYSFVSQNAVEPGRITVRVLADADGAQLHTFEQSGDGVPWSRAGDDYDGDGADDLLLSQAFAFGERGTLTARSASGAQLWTVSAPFRSNSFMVFPGDATGDGVADVAIGTGGPNVALVSGDGGAIAWEVPGGYPAVLGDVNRDGLTDVGVRTIRTAMFAAFETRHAAYTGDGEQLYERSTNLPLEIGRGYSASVRTFLTTADVDGDGLQDTFHEFDVTYTTNPEHVFEGGATSGRTGERLWEDRVPLRLGTRIQGPGTDLVSIVGNSTDAFVEALRGDSLDRLWRTQVPAAGTILESTALGSDVNGDGVGDVVATVMTRVAADSSVHQYGYVLDGRDGHVVW